METYTHFKIQNNYIIVVEDSPVQAKKLRFLLEQNGFEVQICVNGMEALETIKAKMPTLVISDIVMPEMDGYEFCRRLKQDETLKEIPIILLTSLQDPLDIIKGLQAGADNFITKPFDENYLVSRIQYLLANRSIRRSSGGAEMVIEVVFRGQKYNINSERKQILDLLLSVYEAAILRNDELIKTQALLQTANEDLQSTNQELEAFARTVSHDLRTPLHQIVGLTEILQGDFSDKLDEEGRSFLEIIMQSATNMAQLVEDLLKLSMSNKTNLEYAKVDLSRLANQVVNNLKQNEPYRKTNIYIEDNLECNGDQGLLKVVLENLIGNAWKYGGKTDVLELKIGRLTDFKANGFYIKDNGVGFDVNSRHKLFNPFERLHSKEEFPGTGVGLATVKRIIERHNGHIWADSSIGNGATFYWTLP